MTGSGPATARRFRERWLMRQRTRFGIALLGVIAFLRAGIGAQVTTATAAAASCTDLAM
jgi:hypothetical protein